MPKRRQKLKQGYVMIYKHKDRHAQIPPPPQKDPLSRIHLLAWGLRQAAGFLVSRILASR